MITVCVWLPEGDNVGHAGMRIRTNAAETYISWWPGPTSSRSTEDAKDALFGSFHPYRNRSYESDKRVEQKLPDHFVYLRGLDEGRIVKWWKGFGLGSVNSIGRGARASPPLQGPLPPWNLLKQNCSTVVATAPKRGGGDKYASWGASWSMCGVLRPCLNMRFQLRRVFQRRALPRNVDSG
jgi:hypothetical protein